MTSVSRAASQERPTHGVALLRLDRSALLNALNLPLLQAQAGAFTRLEAKV